MIVLDTQVLKQKVALLDHIIKMGLEAVMAVLTGKE